MGWPVKNRSFGSYVKKKNLKSLFSFDVPSSPPPPIHCVEHSDKKLSLSEKQEEEMSTNE